MAQSPALTAPVEKAARTYITRGALEPAVRFLSSDLLEGRGPGTRADQLARLYLQTRLESMRHSAAFAGGSWQQPVDIGGIKSHFPKRRSFPARDHRDDLAW